MGIGNNGTFFIQNVPLGPIDQPTIITAVATDALGNTVSRQITATRVAITANTAQMAVLSGNAQTAPVTAALPAPIAVQMTDTDGVTPFVNKVVTFMVTRSDGRLSSAPGFTCIGDGTMMLQCHTDSSGQAKAMWTMGSDAGCGNNRVEATSMSIEGTVAFCASATAATVSQLNIGSGNNQRAEAGGPAPKPLRVWVSDGQNPIVGQNVLFTVTRGGGQVNGQTTSTVATDMTGHAEVSFTLGPNQGNNVVDAIVVSNPSLQPARFVTYGILRDETISTSFTGIVLNNASQPIGGATCTLTIGATALMPVISDVRGRFAFDDLLTAGPAHLFVDGSTATTINGLSIMLGTYPSLPFEPVLIPNAANSLATPVLLPPLETANGVVFDNSQDITLTLQDMEGLGMLVRAGSARHPDGTVVDAANPITLMLSQVHADDIPMPIPDGASPPFAWTLQPSGTTFDPPIEITYPNMSGLPAGSIAYFLSFDHALSRFGIVATGHVTDDGSQIISDPGAGLTVAGWGCNCPPYSVTGDCEYDECDGDPCCNDRCCDGDPCCDDPSGCCDSGDPCCGNPDRCCNPDNSCCGDPDPCCDSNDPCCGSNDRCCNPDNPCCGSDDPCCDSNDPCCGSSDPCCNSDNPCCAAAARASASETESSIASFAGTPCCGEGADDPCCNNPDPCCPCTAAGTLCCGDHCCTDQCCGAGCCSASQTCCDGDCCSAEETCCGGTDCCEPKRCCGNGECCAQDCEGCLDNGTLSGGVIDVDRDPVCVGDTITFTLSGVVDSGGIMRVDCTAKTPIPAVTPTYKWTVNKPDGTQVKGTGEVAMISATKPGTYTITYTAKAERDCPPSSITIGPKMAEAFEADLDVDSDNNNGTGSPDRSSAEDMVELTAPGKILCLNDDDDDNNNVLDKDQEPPPGADDDLVQMVAHIKQSAPGMSSWQLVYDAAVVQVYESNRMTIVPSGQLFNMPLAPNPMTFWIEGIELTTGSPTSISFAVDLDGDGAFDCSDEVFASVVKVDLDVDSDNSNTTPDFAPQRTMAEETIEDDATQPGRIVWVNNNDDDRDNVADFGDGYNLDSMTGNNDDANTAEIGFVRMVFEIPAEFNLATTTVQVTYNASDPSAAMASTTPPGIVPATGNLRIWTKNGNQTRNAGVIPMGDYVASGSYAPPDLGLSGSMRTVDLWLEGIMPSSSIGAERIIITVDPDGSGPAPPCSDAVRVTVSRLEVLDSMMMLTDHVDIGHWGDDRGTNELSGYTTGANGTVLNGAGGTFVDVDPDRFMVRLTHRPANANATSIEMITVQIGTLTDAGAVDDANHNITMLETGPNTGIFLSESQLLTAPDLTMVTATDQDDGFAVYSARTMATVADEADDDRTHKATFDGHVRATYTGPGGKCDFTVPVCDRVPMDERKEVRIRVHVFNEPFDDVGYDHDANVATPDIGVGNGMFDFNDTNGNGIHDAGEASEPFTDISPDGTRNTVLGSTSNATAHVAAQIERSNQAWGQACIKVIQMGTTIFEEAPTDAMGVNVLRDARFDVLGPATDDRVVIANAVGVAHDVLEAYFTARIFDSLGTGVNAIALPPLVNDPPFNIPVGENSFTFVGINVQTSAPHDLRFRTLAHELGHILTNDFDKTNPQYVFFPAKITFQDGSVSTYRRVRHDIEATARKPRVQGTFTPGSGNRLLMTVP